MTPTPRDAFVVPETIAEVLVPWFALRVGALAREAAPGDAALAARVAEQEAALVPLADRSGELIADVEERLRRSGLAPPPRPADLQGLLEWANAVASAVMGSVRPEQPEGALALLGRCAGEVIQACMVLSGVLHLRGAADLEILRDHEARLAGRLAEWSGRLTGAARFPSLPAAARPHAEAMGQIAEALSRRPPLGAADLMRLCRGAADRLGGQVAALRDALSDTPTS